MILKEVKMKYFQSNIFNNFNFCDISDDMERISVSGTSFLERVHCMEKSFMPRCGFVFPHNSLFSLVLIFPSFCTKSLRSQTLLIGGPVWNNKCKCQRSAHAFQLSGHSFGFPQIVRECMHVWLVQSPPLGWHKSFAMCTQLVPRDTWQTQCVARESSPTHGHRLKPA